ncbi:MAG: sigma-70 family RNA polymerase sigma factor [Myxococcota bacterium]
MAEREQAVLPSAVMERAFDGDPVAFRQFYHRYDPTVRWAVGMRIFRWRALIPLFEDIVQEVWLHLLRRNCKLMRYYKGAHDAPFERFLAVISARLGWKLAKKYLGEPDEELLDIHEDEDWDFAIRIMNADFLEQLARIVAERLDETDRRIFEGHYVEGSKIKDVGAQLGLNENTVYQRKRRLEKKLTSFAEDLLGERTRGGGSELVAVMLAIFVSSVQGAAEPGPGGAENAEPREMEVDDGRA